MYNIKTNNINNKHLSQPNTSQATNLYNANVTH